MKKYFVKKLVLVVLLLDLLIAIGVIYDFIPKSKKVFIDIPKNLSAKQIGRILKQSNLISSEGLFRWMVYFANAEKRIKPGNYCLFYSYTTIPTVYYLVKGPKTIKVTIPEGFTLEQIAERLYIRKVITDPIEFITYVKAKNLDGYLFPETYYFYQGQPIDEVVDKMVKEFYKKYTPDISKKAYELKLSTNQVVILASIIEKEAKTYEEKRIVSGVFHNRLKKGWNLESCATVRYALKKYKEPLTYKDIKVNSKFNTYLYPGLPPAPICNPGIDSIKAAIYPEKTDAMFFFTENNNTHVFSRYYSQHLKEQKNKKRK